MLRLRGRAASPGLRGFAGLGDLEAARESGTEGDCKDSRIREEGGASSGLAILEKMNALCVLFMCASLSTSWYSLVLCCLCCWLVRCYCPYSSAPSGCWIQTLWSRSQLQSRTKQSENHSRNCCGCNFTRARSSTEISNHNNIRTSEPAEIIAFAQSTWNITREKRPQRSQLQSRTKQSENHSRNCCSCNFTRARSSTEMTREIAAVAISLAHEAVAKSLAKTIAFFYS